MNDTICAISTAIGVGGIAIIRVSGVDAIKIVNSIFKGKDLSKVKSHTINYGHIIYENEIIDEVLVSVMKAPHTYTTEDVVEINIHGGIATTNKVLEILLSIGCRLAEPGEFTKRAFLNGRIDLVEAEAVGDLIAAETESARSLSINQLSGKLSDLIRSIRKKILELEANIEVNIDYPEYEDIESVDHEKMTATLESLSSSIDEIIKESTTSRIIKNGINIALIGLPNVGKSSLLNALLEEDRAIVTDIAGTTRDTVEGQMLLSGIVLNFIDTAGIRSTENKVEQIGVEKSLEAIDTADLVIFVHPIDENYSSDEQKLLERIKSKKHIIFINKDDLAKKKKFDDNQNLVYGNTITKDGLDDLKKKITEMFSLNQINSKDFTYVSNARQLALINKVKESIDSAIVATKKRLPIDLIEIDLTNARNYLGDILGERYKEELLDELFSKFCLGK